MSLGQAGPQGGTTFIRPLQTLRRASRKLQQCRCRMRIVMQHTCHHATPAASWPPKGQRRMTEQHSQWKLDAANRQAHLSPTFALDSRGGPTASRTTVRELGLRSSSQASPSSAGLGEQNRGSYSLVSNLLGSTPGFGWPTQLSTPCSHAAEDDAALYISPGSMYSGVLLQRDVGSQHKRA